MTRREADTIRTHAPDTVVRRSTSGGAGDAATAQPRTLTAFVVPHTHWDREWHRPFESFRARLVEVIDEVLTILEDDPEYRRFTLDGQAIVLEDYLELRPEKRDALRRHIQAGRLRIGPWYVLADEFLVSPEALIRNLALGRRICGSFGPPMPVGYTPDSFGHVSQLPLLASGFGLDSVVFERGVGDEGERLRGEFTWVAADGRTQVFAVHLLGTYSAAAAIGHGDWELTDPYSPERAAEQARTVLHGPDGAVPSLPAWLRESFERLPDGIAPYATNGAVVLLNGSDHLFAQREVPALVDDLNERIAHVRFVHGDLEEFVAAARRPPGELESYAGEFRASRYQHILSGVLSSRIGLKQANDAHQTLLERYAEPLATLAWLDGHAYPAHLLAHAWRTLLRNHPHDSICGCSIDAVHDEMSTRFARVRQVGDAVIAGALRGVAHGVAGSGAADGGTRSAVTDGAAGRDHDDPVAQGDPDDPVAVGDLNDPVAERDHDHPVAQRDLTDPVAERDLTVFNPLPWRRSVTVEHTLDLPANSGGEVEATAADGTPLPTQAEVRAILAPGTSDRSVDRTTVRFAAPLPALGLASFRLRRRAGAPARTALTLREGPAGVELENPRVRLTVSPSGEVALRDTATGREVALDLRFEDRADAGDEYDFSPLAGDDAVVVRATAAAPRVLERGPLCASVQLDYGVELPARLTPDRRAREGRVSLPITVELRLDASSPVLGLRVTVDNTAEDHRLRLLVRSDCRVDHVWADGHFDVLRRPVRPPEGAGWFQAPRATTHQRRFVAATDGVAGLALLNRGLPEYEAVETETGVDLAVTLLRCVGWLSREDLASRPQGAGPSLPTPGAQCPGRHVFDLGVLLLAGPWDEGDLLPQAQAFAAPPRAEVGRAPGAAARGDRVVLAPPLELSALKRADDRDSLIVRVVNPTGRDVRGSLHVDADIEAVYRVRLSEDREERLTPLRHDAERGSDGGLRFALDLALSPKQVTTLELVPRERKGGGSTLSPQHP